MRASPYDPCQHGYVKLAAFYLAEPRGRWQFFPDPSSPPALAA
jgi:hypothetical protein